MSDNLFLPLFNSLADIPHALNRLIYKLPNYVEYVLSDKLYYGNTLLIPIGITRNKQVATLELSQSSPITYIVGNTGSGKSTLLRSILATIINNYKHVELILCDAKRCELNLFSRCNNVSFHYDIDDIAEAIDNLYDKVLSIYNRLMLSNKTHCSAYEPTRILVIEEMALLSDKKIQKKLLQLLSICRATNTYCIFTTQRPSCDIINPTVKALVSNRIVLRVEDKKNSIIALDQEGAEFLKGNGHAIIKNANYNYEFQSYFIKEDILLEIINNNLKYNSTTADTNDIINTDDWINKL